MSPEISLAIISGLVAIIAAWIEHRRSLTDAPLSERVARLEERVNALENK